MQFAPEHGCEHAMIALHRWSPDYWLGWNKALQFGGSGSQDKYIFISESGGKTIIGSPPGVDPSEIHTPSPRKLDFYASIPWIVVCEVGELVKNSLPDEAQLDVDGIRQSIKNSYEDRTEERALADLHKQVIDSLRKALKGRNEFEILREIEAISWQIVVEYASLRIAGNVAAQALSYTLMMQANIRMFVLDPDGPRKIFFDPSAMTFLSDLVEHQSNIAYNLVAARESGKLIKYYNDTYLAGLFARTAVFLAIGWPQLNLLARDQTDRLRRIAQTEDERFAHYIAPTFTLPSAFEPDDIIAWTRRLEAKTGRQAESIMEDYCVDPILRNWLPLVGRFIQLDPMSAMSKERRYQRYYDELADLAAVENYVNSMRTQIDPIPPDIRSILFDFICQ
jgi:hypothetical protein